METTPRRSAGFTLIEIMAVVLIIGLLGGIGFTMSIFIADLGFANLPDDLLMAKTGILLASAVAGWLQITPSRRLAREIAIFSKLKVSALARREQAAITT